MASHSLSHNANLSDNTLAINTIQKCQQTSAPKHRTIQPIKSTISMGIRLPFLALHASKIFNKSQQHLQSRNQSPVPKGHIAVYVGEVKMKRFVVPISYLNHPLFIDLLNRAEEEFGFNHPMGGLTIPCKEEAFINLTSKLRASAS